MDIILKRCSPRRHPCELESEPEANNNNNNMETYFPLFSTSLSFLVCFFPFFLSFFLSFSLYPSLSPSFSNMLSVFSLLKSFVLWCICPAYSRPYREIEIDEVAMDQDYNHNHRRNSWRRYTFT